MNKQLFSTLIIISVLMFSCGRENLIYNTPANTGKVKATLFGQVTDESGLPLQGVFVKSGAFTTITDSSGIFQFTNIYTTGRTLVEFSLQNYFNGFKTISILPDEDHYIRTMLIEKKSPATFHTNTGAVIQTDGNGSLTFPANCVVNKYSGAVYNGAVMVYTAMIDPAGVNAGQLMPGSGLGLDQNGKEKFLESYAMLGVELYDNNMQPLQVAPGFKVQLSLPIPPALSASAPAVIPLSHFDETNGMWHQDGTAQLQGGNYVGEVSHFSFLGCHNHAELVLMYGTLKDPNGLPLVNTFVRYTNTQNNATAYDISNSLGKLKSYLPKNANILMEVYDWKCNLVLSTKSFQTSTQDLYVNMIATLPAANSVSVSGILTDCSNIPVKNGYLRLSVNNDYKFISAAANGSFNSSFFICSNPISAAAIVQDNNKNLYGLYENITLNPGSNNLGNLAACGNSSQQFVSWTSTVNGVKSKFYMDDVFESWYDSNTGTQISAWAGSGEPAFYIKFGGTPTNTGTHFASSFRDHLERDTIQNVTHWIPVYFPVNITRYDPKGGMIEGNFEATISNGVMIPNRKISGYFRVRRS